MHREKTLATEMRFPSPGRRERAREAGQLRPTSHVQGLLLDTAPEMRLSPGRGAAPWSATAGAGWAPLVQPPPCLTWARTPSKSQGPLVVTVPSDNRLALSLCKGES